MPAKCGWITLKQGLPGNYYPGRAGEFPKATRLGLACVQAALTLQRKGKGGDGEQVKVCLACFSGATWQILPASGCAQDGAGVKRQAGRTWSMNTLLCQLYEIFIVRLIKDVIFFVDEGVQPFNLLLDPFNVFVMLSF